MFGAIGRVGSRPVDRKDSHNSNCIVVEDGRDVFGGEFVCRVADEKAGLANGTVTDDYTSVRAYH